jgi:hypothetical protein
LMAGCGPTVAKTTGGGKPHAVVKPAPEAPAPRKAIIPETRHLGPVLNMNVWKIQCSKGNLAMTCRKADPTDRRCAWKRSGKYRWIYGSYCKRGLGCYRKACP